MRHGRDGTLIRWLSVLHDRLAFLAHKILGVFLTSFFCLGIFEIFWCSNSKEFVDLGPKILIFFFGFLLCKWFDHLNSKQFQIGVLNITLDLAALVLVGVAAFFGCDMVLAPFGSLHVRVGVGGYGIYLGILLSLF